jgi:hypothetical protein
VDPFRPQFAGHALRERAQRELRAREGREARAAAKARGGAGEEDRAASPGNHPLRRGAPGEEAAEAAELPDLAVHVGRCFDERPARVGAGVVEAHLHRPDLALGVLEQRLDVRLAARVHAHRPDRRARRGQLFDEWRGSLRTAPRDDDGMAAGREPARERSADRFAGTDGEGNGEYSGHRRSLRATSGQ